jgi:hypothetical protein
MMNQEMVGGTICACATRSSCGHCKHRAVPEEEKLDGPTQCRPSDDHVNASFDHRSIESTLCVLETD